MLVSVQPEGALIITNVLASYPRYSYSLAYIHIYINLYYYLLNLPQKDVGSYLILLIKLSRGGLRSRAFALGQPGARTRATAKSGIRPSSVSAPSVPGGSGCQ